MPDREKVIKGLKCCMSESLCYKCPYKDKDECEDGSYYYSKAIEDAITLLQQRKEAIRCKDCKHHHYSSNHIPYCDKHGWGWRDNDFCSYIEKISEANCSTLKPREERREVKVNHVWGDEVEVWSEFYCPHCGAMIAKGNSEHYPRCMWCGEKI